MGHCRYGFWWVWRTDGVSYLRGMLDIVLFPEIWTLRTDL